MAKATKSSPVSEVPIAGATEEPGKIAVQAAQFPEVTEGQVTTANPFDLLLDVDVPVTVALGQAQVPIRRLLQLGPGAVLSLGRPLDAPAELYLQGTKFAEGDIVVVDDRFGIRIRQILGLESGESKPA